MSKVDTISYQGKDYATVPARLKEFRQTNPRASITTEPRFIDDGAVVFQATIVQDLADENSARATGTAMYTKGEMAGKKSFEKLETISIGRALAVLGYLNNGDVATSEEMAEFYGFQEEKFQSLIDKAEKREDFISILGKMNADQKKHFTPIINKRIQELKDAVPAN